MRLGSSLLLLAAAAGGAEAWSWPWSRHVSVHSSSVAPKTRMEDGSILMEWRSKPAAGAHAHKVWCCVGLIDFWVVVEEWGRGVEQIHPWQCHGPHIHSSIDTQ